MFHIVYRVTNVVNGKFYVGYHKTADLNDKYLGSGTVLRRAVAKYGEENFRKEVLFTFDNAVEAFQKEEEVVKQHKDDPMCYNLRKGGKGGFDYINQKGLRPERKRGKDNPRYGKPIKDSVRAAVIASNKRRRIHPVRSVQHVGVAEANRRRVWSQESRDKLGRANKAKTVTTKTRAKMSLARSAWWAHKKRLTP
jgi:hypothetical protein